MTRSRKLKAVPVPPPEPTHLESLDELAASLKEIADDEREFYAATRARLAKVEARMEALSRQHSTKKGEQK